jgi:hypothetical protein
MSKQNPNSGMNRVKRGLNARWSAEDYPGAEPRFHWQLLSKDIAVFILLPISAVIFYKSLDGSGKPNRSNQNKQQQAQKDQMRVEGSKSQIIDFGGGRKIGSGGTPGISKRAPGTLVKLKLQNVVETYSNAPVHAQIIDAGLGRVLQGGSLIGDATPDGTFERITIDFRFARDPSREGVAFSISARALGLDGTLGLVANKKEGFVTRSVLGSASNSSQELRGRSNSPDLKDILIRALTSGLFQEIGTSSQVEKARSQVLTLTPGTEFFAELTDYFPGANK